jgi:hypothetical protein
VRGSFPYKAYTLVARLRVQHHDWCRGDGMSSQPDLTVIDTAQIDLGQNNSHIFSLFSLCLFCTFQALWCIHVHCMVMTVQICNCVGQSVSSPSHSMSSAPRRFQGRADACVPRSSYCRIIVHIYKNPGAALFPTRGLLAMPTRIYSLGVRPPTEGP